MELFGDCCTNLFGFFHDNYPNIRIILNSMRVMENKTLDDGSVVSFVNSENYINKSLEVLEDYIRDNFDVIFIDFEETSLDENHIWGPGMVHFSKEYYQYTYRKILKYVYMEKYDELNKSYVELNKSYVELNKSYVELNKSYVELNKSYDELNSSFFKKNNSSFL